MIIANIRCAAGLRTLVPVFLALGAGCASGGNPPSTTGAGAGTSGRTTAGTTQSKQIGPAGGALSAPDGTSVTIPPSALSTTLTITLTPAPTAPAPAGIKWVGTPYILGPEGTTFALPVTVTLAFSPSSLPAGKTSSQVVVETAAAGSSSYISLGGTLADSTHVRATTSHFSTFGPGVDDSSSETTGGSSIGGESTTTGSSAGTTGSSSTGGDATSSGSTTGAEGSTSGGSSTGCSPDAGVVVEMPSSMPNDGGCIGAVGCMVIAVSDDYGTQTQGAICGYPFIAKQVVAAEILSGNSVDQNTLSIVTGTGNWQIAFELPACPDPDGGSVSVNAVIELYPTIGAPLGGCSKSPLRAQGTIDFEPSATGIAGTFHFGLLGGMTGALSFVQDPDLCEAPSMCPVEIPGDAGSAECEADGGCSMLDGGFAGVAELSVRGQDGYGDNWCYGPFDVSTQATFTDRFDAPTFKIGPDTGGWQLEADLSCCPSGEGSLPATMYFHTFVAGGQTNYCPTLPSAGLGSVTFETTDAGLLTGWITADAGTLQVFATF